MLTLDEVKTAIAFDQPKLSARVDGANILIEGIYLVVEGTPAAASGPITEFAIRMEVNPRYPHLEPKVFEVTRLASPTVEKL